MVSVKKPILGGLETMSGRGKRAPCALRGEFHHLGGTERKWSLNGSQRNFLDGHAAANAEKDGRGKFNREEGFACRVDSREGGKFG